jgi:hypothetical protein
LLESRVVARQEAGEPWGSQFANHHGREPSAVGREERAPR